MSVDRLLNPEPSSVVRSSVDNDVNPDPDPVSRETSCSA